MEIYKRNGQKVLFDESKIINSIKAAYESVGEVFYEENLTQLLNYFNTQNFQNWSVEDIQDRVERILMRMNPKVAKAYILYR